VALAVVAQVPGTATVTVKVPVCPGCNVPIEQVTGAVPLQLPVVGLAFETYVVFCAGVTAPLFGGVP
jgi:hypothetical protein